MDEENESMRGVVKGTLGERPSEPGGECYITTHDDMRAAAAGAGITYDQAQALFHQLASFRKRGPLIGADESGEPYKAKARRLQRWEWHIQMLDSEHVGLGIWVNTNSVRYWERAKLSDLPNHNVSLEDLEHFGIICRNNGGSSVFEMKI